MLKHLWWMYLLLTQLTQAQTVTVIDKTTRQPIEGALVYSHNPAVNVQTNGKGQLLLSLFQQADTIFVKMVGYETVATNNQLLRQLNWSLELEESEIALEDVTVLTNRTVSNKLENPNRIEKLNMTEAAFQNPQTTADLLGTSGYAYIQKSQLGGGSPMLRGMATNRVLLVVDGVRMNNAIFRSGNLQNVISIDAHALENTEILFGPGSVIYGSDAIGGVMTFNTIEPRAADSTEKVLARGNGLTRSSTANSEKTMHMDASVGFKKWAFVTSATRSEYGDLRSGTRGGDNYFYRSNYVITRDGKDWMVNNPDSALQIGSRYSQNNFMQKIRYQPNRFMDLNYAFHFSETSPYNRYDRLYVMQTAGPYKNKLRWAEWYYGPQKWSMHRLAMNHNHRTRLYDHLHFVSAWQNFEESRYDREFMVRELRMQEETVRAISVNLDLDKRLNDQSQLIYGAEAVHNLVGSIASLTHVITNEVTPTVTRYPNGSTWQSYGVYAGIKQHLGKKLILSTGIRYSYYQINAVFDTTYFPFPFTFTKMKNGTLNGSLGLVYSIDKSFQTYFNMASGYRAPNIDDMGKVFESTPGYLVVPNPELKPEHVYNAEVGCVKSYKNIVRYDFAAYYTYMDDAMERKDFLFNGQSTIRFQGNKSYIQAVQNVANAYVYGIQTGLECFYKGFGLKSTYSYQHGKEQSGDSLIYYPLRHAAPMFGSTHFTYQRKKMKIDIYAVYNGKMDYQDLALTERINTSYARDYSKSRLGEAYVSAWYTLNVKTAYYPNEYMAINIGMENILDRLYRPYSSGINAPGRNFIVAMKVKF
jgi:hemoglobin/transferrin/lactoferrin receptor protein